MTKTIAQKELRAHWTRGKVSKWDIVRERTNDETKKHIFKRVRVKSLIWNFLKLIPNVDAPPEQKITQVGLLQHGPEGLHLSAGRAFQDQVGTHNWEEMF